VNPQLRSSHIK